MTIIPIPTLHWTLLRAASQLICSDLRETTTNENLSKKLCLPKGCGENLLKSFKTYTEWVTKVQVGRNLPPKIHVFLLFPNMLCCHCKLSISSSVIYEQRCFRTSLKEFPLVLHFWNHLEHKLHMSCADLQFHTASTIVLGLLIHIGRLGLSTTFLLNTLRFMCKA